MKFQYLGKNIKGSINQLSNRFDVSNNEITDLQTNSKRYLLNKKTGEISRVNLKESPLLIRAFGVKKINNKIITGGEIKKNVFISKNPITLNKKLTGYIRALIRVVWMSSGNEFRQEINIQIDKVILSSEQKVRDQIISDFLDAHSLIKNDIKFQAASINIIELEFIGKNEVKFDFNNYQLRGKPLDISKIYGENVDLNYSNDNNCVKNYLLKTYKKISNKSIEKIGTIEGITPDQLYNFCNEYNIKMILFNITGEIVKSLYPVKKSKSHKALIGIVYNNHFYPLKNPELHRVPLKKIKNNIYCDNLDDKLIEIINNNNYCDNLTLYNNNISSIQVDNNLYHQNKDFNFCELILKKLGLSDKMDFFINKINVSNIIEKLFIKDSIDSFFPYNSNEGGFNFVNDGFIDDDDEITIDHNKHYSDALRKLEQLIIIDIKTAQHIMKPSELTDGYFYIAKPKYSSILMPKTGFYSYDFLLYCKNEGLEFDLLEAVSCIYKTNYFKDMINTLYEKLNKDEFKDVINCMIGKMEKKGDKKQNIKFLKIANKDETERSEGYVKKINDDYNIIYDIQENVNTKLYNRVPIRVQAICQARKIIYEKMKELNLNLNDIRQIRTDAITFKPKKKFTAGYEMGEWKQQDAKILSEVIDIYDEEMTFKLKSINEINTIYIDYAGSGKTYFIINKLLPTLNDFVVLSPSHASIKEYRKNNINCNVIQKYLFNNQIPKEKNIIIDEIGMIDTKGNNFLIKCALLGKNIYSFGDFKQLKPVNSEISNSDIYLKYLYNNICTLGSNYRNDFSFEYYDKLFNMTNRDEIKKEIIKYTSKNYFDCDTIITYTNEQRIKYNNLMSKKLNLKFGDIGCRIVCKSYILSSKNIYNNFYYTIKDIDEDNVIITDDVEDIKITKKELEENFDFGYCRTLYNIQGESIKSFYFALEDIDYIDGRGLYTLISRLKN